MPRFRRRGGAHLRAGFPPGLVVELVLVGGCLRNEAWLAPAMHQDQGQGPPQSTTPPQPALGVPKPHAGGRPRQLIPAEAIAKGVHATSNPEPDLS